MNAHLFLTSSWSSAPHFLVLRDIMLGPSARMDYILDHFWTLNQHRDAFLKIILARSCPNEKSE